MCLMCLDPLGMAQDISAMLKLMDAGFFLLIVFFCIFCYIVPNISGYTVYD